MTQESYFDDGADGFCPFVEFLVLEEMVRVVPLHQTDPVRARHLTPDSTQPQISLQIAEAKLSHRFIDFTEQDHFKGENAIDVVQELIDRWPDQIDLQCVHGSIDGRHDSLS